MTHREILCQMLSLLVVLEPDSETAKLMKEFAERSGSDDRGEIKSGLKDRSDLQERLQKAEKEIEEAREGRDREFQKRWTELLERLLKTESKTG